MEEIARVGEQTTVLSGKRSPSKNSHPSYTYILYEVLQNPLGFVSRDRSYD